MADKVSPPPEGGWESLKVDELKAELEARGLPKSGTKAELIERLLDDDAGQAVSAAAPAAEKEAAPEDAEQITSVETPEPDSEEAEEAGEDAAGAADADEEAAEQAGDDDAGEPEAKKPRRRR